MVDNFDRYLSQRVHPEDTFVLFMAGQSKVVDGRFYFAPHDLRGSQNDELIAQKAIPSPGISGKLLLKMIPPFAVLEQSQSRFAPLPRRLPPIRLEDADLPSTIGIK
jgi:hypothetical protein